MAAASRSAKERALRYISESTRIGWHELTHNPGAKTRPGQVTKRNNRCGQGMKELQAQAKPPLGWIWGDFFKPWQRQFPADEHFNKDVHLKREYPPISLVELQRLIDLGWINPARPIDLSTLCNTGRYSCDPVVRQFGVQLTDEGSDVFASALNIEVQWATELCIATIERLGGVIMTSYYDPTALTAITKPKDFFMTGRPIPRRAYPPGDLIEYYTDPKNRGYLAKPSAIEWHRKELAQKYGYEYRPISAEIEAQPKKTPQQIFYGLQPGWVVNLPDRTILKPVDENLAEYYESENLHNLMRKEHGIAENEPLFEGADGVGGKKKKKKKKAKN